jgi:hypothetical protein
MTPQQIVESPTPPAPKVSVVQPERNAWHPLEVAEQRISGFPVPTGLIVRHRKPGMIIAECQTIIKEIKTFYKSMNYVVLGQEKGFKIVPSKEALAKLPEATRKLATESEVFIFKGHNRWWTFQIHGPETRLDQAVKPDPMDYISRPKVRPIMKNQKPRVAGRKLQASPQRPEPRVYKRGRAIDIRDQLDTWRKQNKSKRFID